VVQGNRIGTGKNGAPLGNFNDGVLLDSASGCQIGGASPGAGNVVAFNGPPFDLPDDADDVADEGAGVVVSSNANNHILRNSIFSNFGLGIDLSSNFPLDGVTPNDPGDGDGGPNGRQNFPVINSATSTGVKTIIRGELDSAAGETYIVQFFSSPAADPSGNGEGKTYLGQRTNVTTDASGHASFRFVYKKEIRRGWVSATATSSDDGTSEFSNARKVMRQR
jgi:hypothetical protein